MLFIEFFNKTLPTITVYIIEGKAGLKLTIYLHRYIRLNILLYMRQVYCNLQLAAECRAHLIMVYCLKVMSLAICTLLKSKYDELMRTGNL